MSYGSSCYRAESDSASRVLKSVAEADCATDGAYLVSINDQDEHNYIHGLM